MLITKHGKAGTIRAFKCPHCECEFLANAHEYAYGELEMRYVCGCPECRRTAWEADE